MDHEILLDIDFWAFIGFKGRGKQRDSKLPKCSLQASASTQKYLEQNEQMYALQYLNYYSGNNISRVLRP